ncbi:hypothetical protein BaRGS_00026705 [Batillaria attramentaria]|uniref:Tetraspanin-33 n=1 Tax=Batillaria attramentaria TaxID=370345 RepID=A0ABD0K4L1_9CAEN
MPAPASPKSKAESETGRACPATHVQISQANKRGPGSVCFILRYRAMQERQIETRLFSLGGRNMVTCQSAHYAPLASMEDDTELFDDPVVAPKPVKSPTRPDGHDSKPWPTRPDGNDSKQLPTQPDGNDSRPWPTRPDGNDSKPWSTRPDGSDSKPWPTRPDGKNSKQERTGHSAQTGFPLTEWKINFNQKIPREKGKPNTSASAREWRGFPERGVRSESLPHYDDSNDIAPIDFSPRVIFKRDESPDDLLWSPACSMLPSDTEDCSNADPDKTRDEDKPFQDITKDRLHKDISGSYWRTPGKQAMALMAFRHAEVDLPDIDASDSPASGVEQHEDRLSPDSFFDEPNQDHHKQSFRQHDSDSKLLSLDPLRDDQQQFHTMYELPNHPQPCEILYNDSTPATVTTPSDDPLQSSVTSGIEAQGVDPDAEIAEDEDSGDLRAFEQPGAGYFDTGQPSNPRAQADESSSRYLRDHDDLDGSRNPLMMTDLQKERRQHGGDHPADRHLRDHSDQDGFMDRLVMTDVEKERRHHGRGLPAGRHLRDHSDQDGSRDRLVMTDVEKERRHHGRGLPAGRHLRDHSDQDGSRDRLVMTDVEKERRHHGRDLPAGRHLRDHSDQGGSRDRLVMTDVEKERRHHGRDLPAGRHLRDHSDQDGFMDRLVMTDVEKERRHHGRDLPAGRHLRDHSDQDGFMDRLVMTDVEKERRHHGRDLPAGRHLRDHSDQDGFMDRLVMTDVEKERRHHGRDLPAGRHLRDHSDQGGSMDRLVMTDVEKERRHHGRDLPAGRHLRDHSDQDGSRDRLVMTDLEKEGGIQGCPEEADRESDDPTAYKHETLAGHDDTLTASRMGLFLQRRSRKRKRVSGVRMVAVLLKYCLFVLNFIFWVASVGAIVTGAWVLSERGQLVREPTAFFLDPSAMTCLVGAITFVVAFIGCLGALRENICLLKTSQLSMLGVLVLEALIGATVFAFYAMPEVRRHIKAGPEEVLKMAIRRYHDDEELQRWVDLIQREFKCCGASHSDTGYMDWTENAYFNCTSANPSAQRCAVPRSCCIIERGEYINYMCGFDSTNKNPSELFDRIYTQGCMKGLGKWLSSHDVAIGSASIAIIIPQIICVIFARLLIQHIQRQRVRWRVLHSSK